MIVRLSLFQSENETKSERTTQVDGSVGTPNGDTLTNTQNIEEIPSSQDEVTSSTFDTADTQNSENIVRRRKRKRSYHRQDRHSTTESANTSKSNFTLVLIFIFTVCLLSLLARRIYYK